jgi:signal transduction histidine kinase
VSNLVGNAVTHGTEGTPVRVDLVGGDQVVLTIHNESAPIPEAQLSTLFDPFRRGERSRRGLGLGLYITDQIVRAHGGSVIAESDASGTTFRVTLPR